jgi:hypothetical protein
MGKSEIMSLFAQSQPPMPTQQLESQQQSTNPYQSQQQLNPYHSQQPSNPYQNQNQSQQQSYLQNFDSSNGARSVSTPLSAETGFGGNKNPFMHNHPQGQQSAQQNGKVGGAQGGLLAASGLDMRDFNSQNANGNNTAVNANGGVNGGLNGTGTAAGRGHVSQESMAISANGWFGTSGRHSPDAFANLSARTAR